jgi:hypothetical protein
VPLRQDVPRWVRPTIISGGGDMLPQNLPTRFMRVRRPRLDLYPVPFELCGRPIVEATKRPLLVIVEPNAFQPNSRLGNRHEEMHVPAFVAHGSIEAFPEAVLSGTARIDVQGRNLLLRQPTSHRQGYELWPIIAAEERR